MLNLFFSNLVYFWLIMLVSLSLVFGGVFSVLLFFIWINVELVLL